MLAQTISLFILLGGFVIGLGAVTVIDFHGFLARHSKYWTLATTRTHKITKPLIWLGTLLITVGGFLFYKDFWPDEIISAHTILLLIMICNGLFLSFVVSPFLIEKEKRGQAEELLPKQLQQKITASFVISFLSWWGNLFLLAWFLVNKF